MCSAHCLMMFYIYVRFKKISQTLFNVQSIHIRKAIFHVQRAIDPELKNLKLWFMHSACCLMMLYICVKFRENISNGIRVMEWT